MRIRRTRRKSPQHWGHSAAKRCFDLALALPLLFLLSPLMVLIALAIRWDSPGPALFRQQRMGRGFRKFDIYKFRTMIDGALRMGLPLTAGNDSRITRLGRFLRKTKLDELPQLINVLKGDMSLVGPRPEIQRYVEMFPEDYRQILTVRPGITDPASLAYRAEADLLARAASPEDEYVRHVLPNKIALSRQYLERSSLRLDLAVLLKTLGTLGNSLPSACRRPLRDNTPAGIDPSSSQNVDQRLPRH